jgi:flagellar protein FlaG
MSNTPAILPVTPDSSVGQAPLGRSEYLSPAALQQDQTTIVPPQNLRLVIEEDQRAGTVVYKTVDWRTGVVVQQLPREQVLKLRETQNYSAGQLVATKA